MIRGNRIETEMLTDLAAQIAKAVPSSAPRLAPLRAELKDIAELADLEIERLTYEARLEELSVELRKCWLSIAHETADNYFKSPPLTQRKRSVMGDPVEFSYERNLQPTLLEDRLAYFHGSKDGWQSAHVVFRSGQAGLMTLLTSWLSMLRPPAEAPMRLGMYGAYFETQMMLRLLERPGFEWSRLDTASEISRAIESYGLDVLLLETVCYDWELEPLDINKLVSAWEKQRGRGLSMTIFDTTLSGPFFPLDPVLETLRQAEAQEVIVAYTSALKLHQMGLELSNVGLISIFTPKGSDTVPEAAQIADYIRAMRTIHGSTLTFDESVSLEAPWFLEPVSFRRHCKSVFVNNALAADALNGIDGLFERVAHPSLLHSAEQAIWAQAPFCVVHLKEDTLEAHGLLLGVLGYEAQRRGLSFVHGSSFGFRGHRYETIIPKMSEGRGLFKVAMGARSGPSRQGVLSLLQEIGSYPDMSSLRAAYPEVSPVSMEP